MCAFEDAARYANQRVQFGEAIGRFQLIQEKFAHMAIKLNSMKNMLYEAAWKADNGTITSGDAAMCKYFCANAAFEVVDSAMQVLGGVGIAGNHRISRFWRDLRVDRVSGDLTKCRSDAGSRGAEAIPLSPCAARCDANASYQAYGSTNVGRIKRLRRIRQSCAT